MAVNLSAANFRNPNLVPLIARTLADNALDARLLVLEITGYSSLSRLKRFPLDHLKIDQSFVILRWTISPWP